jgi:hypothetical protein
MAVQFMYRVEVTDEPAQPMVLFWQFDVREEFGLPFKPGSHFLAMMCPEHNDAALFSPTDDALLPPRFWELDIGHYAVLLLPPGAPTQAGELDKYLQPRRIRYVKAPEEVAVPFDFASGTDAFKVGGIPHWINFAPAWTCSCGGKMQFVGQIPDSFGFAQRPDAPEQPNSFSRTEYCYLLGNAVFFLACDRQCDPRAVMAICDN